MNRRRVLRVPVVGNLYSLVPGTLSFGAGPYRVASVNVYAGVVYVDLMNSAGGRLSMTGKQAENMLVLEELAGPEADARWFAHLVAARVEG